MISAHCGGGGNSQLLFPPMTSPLTSSSPQLDSSRLSIPATVILEALAFPERGYNEKRAENDLLSSASPGPQLNLKSSGAWFDLMSARAWRNHVVWRAGVSFLKVGRASDNYKLLRIFSGHRGCSLRVSEFLVRFVCRNAHSVAARGRTRGDTGRQHGPRISHHLRHGFDDRRTHQFVDHNGHCV